MCYNKPMLSQYFLFFLALLILPSAYQRVHFALKRSAFMKTELRDKSGLAIHHGHWGLLFVFIASFALAFGYRNFWIVALMFYGWGLILDEIVPMLKMPSVGREKELEVYARTLSGTIWLVGIVAALAVAAFLASASMPSSVL